MQDTNIFIHKLDETQRPIEWAELNQLKKDILWVFDENGSDLPNSFVPDYSFTLPYWEYMTLQGNWIYEEEKRFYSEGSMIIILCMVAEYVDIVGGSQLVFGNTEIANIINYVNKLESISEDQSSLKELLLLGLSIAATITKEDIAKNVDYQHPDLDKFYSRLPWVEKTFIIPYYQSKLNRTTTNT